MPAMHLHAFELMSIQHNTFRRKPGKKQQNTMVDT